MFLHSKASKQFAPIGTILVFHPTTLSLLPTYQYQTKRRQFAEDEGHPHLCFQATGRIFLDLRAYYRELKMKRKEEELHLPEQT
ncbi:hypothetical protein D3C87_1613930 [compost metagenome]